MRFALIPARNGSKRIPDKNIREFNGKPIIGYSIENALLSGLFDEVIVSTDSEQIANVAQDFGASVPFIRPKELADDFTPTRPIISHAIEEMKKIHRNVTHCCCIYATAPLLQTEYLVKGIESLIAQPDKRFAFSVTEFNFPIQRALQIVGSEMSPMYPEFVQSRSQDLPKAYHDAGQFYWGTTEGFLSEAALFSNASIPIVLPSYLVQDIDTLDDWLRAELIRKVL